MRKVSIRKKEQAGRGSTFVNNRSFVSFHFIIQSMVIKPRAATNHDDDNDFAWWPIVIDLMFKENQVLIAKQCAVITFPFFDSTIFNPIL